MNKRVSLSLILITGMLFMSSCFNPQVFTNSRTKLLDMYSDNEKSQVDARLEQVLDAIKNKDAEMIKSMFSEQAIGEIAGFEESCECLFGFFTDEATAIERVGPQVSESHNSSRSIKNAHTYYYVSTEEREYIFYFY